MAGREPQGIVPPNELRGVRDSLRHDLQTLQDERGAPVPTLVRVPEETYRQVRGFPPDLMVYFDDLRLRAVGSVGHDRRIVTDNDTGPDACNHAWHGIHIAAGPTPPQRVDNLYEISATILNAFHIQAGQRC